ncbi:hypothetical protein BZG36_01048 [Bifiguratus adelaidae]|uniref:Anaphase-promoting complex subunit 4 WD40 domain-containing protein n=1 Tax=Bifiguratus adelaidae TaxID=1938954 RepID=A0A261Y6D7_9FUNG|nr:hypothetical protein BZG36_01048 [Bifiguratus adelaidae]
MQSANLFPPLAPRKVAHFSLAGEYIFDIAKSSQYYAVSASNHEIKLYHPQTLNMLDTLRFHKDTISSIRIRNDHILISSSHDGSVVGHDLRAGYSPVFGMNAGMPVLSFDINCNDTLFCAGTELHNHDSNLLFWDPRNPSSLIGKFSESHSDDITQVQFHPYAPSKFLSGSTDGLVCMYDIKVFDEDEEMTGVVNSGSSVSKTGWFGPAAEYVYCLTHIETFSLSIADAAEDASNLLHDFGDIRALSNPGLLQVDYAIDCHYDESTQRLFLTTGSHSGDLSLLHVNLKSLQLCQNIQQAHSEVIRACHWEIPNHTLLTGGEDGKLCLWQPNQQSSTPPPLEHSTATVGKSRRHAPY